MTYPILRKITLLKDNLILDVKCTTAIARTTTSWGTSIPWSFCTVSQMSPSASAYTITGEQVDTYVALK